MYSQLFTKILCLALFVGIAPVAPSTAAQKRNAGNQTPAAANAPCSGAWSGIVRYERTFEDALSDDKTYKNYTGASSSLRRKQRRQTAGRIILDGKSDPAMGGMTMNVGGVMMGASAQSGRAGVTVTETENETSQTVTQDNCGWETRQKKCDYTRTRNGQVSAEGTEQFFLQFKGGSYDFSFRLPEANGTIETVSKNSCTGLCNGDTRGGETHVDPVRYNRETVSVKNQEFDPKNPDRLQGVYQETSRDGKTTIFVWWNLRRCAPPLQLLDVRFTVHSFPDDKKWVGVQGKSGTYDGNYVRVVARVLNTSPAAQTATVDFSELEELLPEPRVQTSVAGGEIKDVEYFWDTRGFAWNDSGAPHSLRKIRVRLNSEMIEEDFLVKPKPVVLVGGYWTKPDAWKSYADYLKNAHSEHWTASPVGVSPSGDRNIDPKGSFFQNAARLKEHIQALRERLNAWHVDLVAHSTGGLAARYYIHHLMPEVYDKRPEVAHLVMLGTPNNGTPCAQLFTKSDLIFGKPGEALRELLPAEMKIFNRNVLKRKGTIFSALAGSASALTCVSLESGDGFVPVSSAAHNIDDASLVKRAHQELTGEQDFKNFVKPRLSLSPHESRMEQSGSGGALWIGEIPSTPDFNALPPSSSWQASTQRKVFFEPGADAPDETLPGVTLSTVVKIPAGQTTEIDVPVLTGSRGAVVLMADANVSATLSDAGGKVVGTSAGADAEQVFRTIPVPQPVGGNLKLRLKNTGAEETPALVAAWTDTDPLQFTLSAKAPNGAGKIQLLAKLTLNGAPVAGALVKALAAKQKTEILFFDDGKHADGAAGDGVYGATTGKPGAGDYWITATAEHNGQTRTATAMIRVGAPE